MWKLIDQKNKDILNIRKIFPLKQRAVGDLVRAAAKVVAIERVTIFGSSVMWRCNHWSDIDVYIQGVPYCPDEIYSELAELKLGEVFNFWADEATEGELLANILREGVVVYERQE